MISWLENVKIKLTGQSNKLATTQHHGQLYLQSHQNVEISYTTQDMYLSRNSRTINVSTDKFPDFSALLQPGLSYLGRKWSRFAPTVTNPDLFQIRIQYILARWANLPTQNGRLSCRILRSEFGSVLLLWYGGREYRLIMCSYLKILFYFGLIIYSD